MLMNDPAFTNWKKALTKTQINVLQLLVDYPIFRYTNNNVWRDGHNARFHFKVIEKLKSLDLVREYSKTVNTQRHFSRQQLAITGKGRDVLDLIKGKT